MMLLKKQLQSVYCVIYNRFATRILLKIFAILIAPIVFSKNPIKSLSYDNHNKIQHRR